MAVAQPAPADAKPKPPTVRCLAFSPDGKSLAVVHSSTNLLVVWDVVARTARFTVREKSGIASVAYSPQGDVLAIGTAKVAKLLDPATGQLRRELTGHEQTVRCLAFTPDGKQLVTAGNDRTVRFWDLATGETQRTVSGCLGSIVGIALSPDGKWLATTCGTDDKVKLWSLERPAEPPHEFDVQQAYVPQVLLSPDSRYLVIPNWSGTVLVNDVKTKEEFLRFRYLGGVQCAAISPSGQLLALAHDKSIDLAGLQPSVAEEQRRQIDGWIEQFQDDDYAKREAASKQLAAVGSVALGQLRAGLDSSSAEVRIRCRRLVERIEDLEFATKLTGHTADSNWVAFSHDGKLLASGDWDGIVKLWNLADDKEVATLESR